MHYKLTYMQLWNKIIMQSYNTKYLQNYVYGSSLNKQYLQKKSPHTNILQQQGSPWRLGLTWKNSGKLGWLNKNRRQ